MKFRVLALATMTAALLAGCSGVVTPKAELASHDSDHNIPAIDEMIISYKQDYINKCYIIPILKCMMIYQIWTTIIPMQTNYFYLMN